MDSQYQKWVNISYLAVAVLLAFIVFVGGQQVVGFYDLETRVKNVELILRGVSILVGAGLFVALYRNEKVNQFMTEVVVELSRVTWPTQKETSSATFIVLIMVLISGMVLGFFDYLWTNMLQWVL